VVNHVDGAARVFPIIGDPVEYAQSPARLTRTFNLRRHNGVCVPMQVPAGSLPEALAGLSATLNVDGVLVTMPHKFDAAAHCATLSRRSLRLGAVSVMRRNADRSWHGDMLDGLAFLKAQAGAGALIADQRAFLLGAGGAGSAIAAALLDGGVGELAVHDRDGARVETLYNLLRDERMISGPPDPTGYNLVFNATNVGMWPGPR
jgi:shikimate dehydrogenase